MVLMKVKRRGLVLCVLLQENLKIRSKNALLTIGNVVSVLVITVINHFSYTLTNAKVLQKRHTSSLKPLLFKRWVAK